MHPIVARGVRLPSIVSHIESGFAYTATRQPIASLYTSGNRIPGVSHRPELTENAWKTFTKIAEELKVTP